MENIYMTVKSALEARDGLLYKSIVSGQDFLHYDAECLLQYIAEQILRNGKKYVVFRNNIPSEETALRETLDDLVRGHNMALKLGCKGEVKGRKEARRVLKMASCYKHKV
ncbi:MAG: hypothetical protein V1837_06230 [Candidatus Woesearchaeota archaeon]